MNFFEIDKESEKTKHPLDQQVEAGLRGDFKTGWKIAKTLEKETPECHRSAFNRGWYYLMRGELLKGLELLDRGRWAGAFGDSPLPTDKPIWKDQDLKGKFLLFCSEGGLGDEIINARFVTDFAKRGAKVTVTCDPSLVGPFSRIDGVASVVGHKRAPDIFHDYWVPGMSAARVLGYNYENLTGEPYLYVDPLHKKKWQKILSHSSARIGLRFFGNPQFEHEQHRRFPKQDLIDCLGDLPWLNLQKEETNLNLESWDDTLAVIDCLELVITSCTSVAHASAALGKKTWLITPIMPYYTWALPGNKSPWYDSVRLFRQTEFGNWSSVFLKIKEALNDEGYL